MLATFVQMKDMGKYLHAKRLPKEWAGLLCYVSSMYFVFFFYSDGMLCGNWITHFGLPQPSSRHSYG